MSLEFGGKYMEEKMMNWIHKLKNLWESRTKTQKGIFVGTIGLILILIIGGISLSTNKNYVPLYSNLSLYEAGQIKEELESRGVPYQLEDGGTTITVPEDQASTLLVDLASQQIPQSGQIDFSYFSENASWGITNNEFNMIKLDAMNNELAKLIKRIEGIEEAQVMITLPEESVFVSEDSQEASASIVIHTKRGYQFQPNQIDALYHLVSKAVPNLPRENIIIMNQYSEYLDESIHSVSGEQQAYTFQQMVKRDTERDIQRRLQQMLGAMVGMDSVIVSVTADIDFTQENRVEELIEPVDVENMEGLPVSIETIHETYTGTPGVGGIPGSGEEDIPGSEALDGTTDGEYELIKETINNEFNHIRREIVESPYKIRDLGIQVAVNNVLSRDGDEIQYLTPQEQNSVEEGISSILNSIISTSIDEEYGDIDPEEKISIVFQEFTGVSAPSIDDTTPTIPMWMYVVGALLIIIIIALILIIFRSRQSTEEEMVEEVVQPAFEVPDLEVNVESEAEMQRMQLEKLAEENPEDFAKLLRSWLSDD